MSYCIHAQRENETNFCCSFTNGESFFISPIRKNVHEFENRETADYVSDILKDMNPDYDYFTLDLN